MKSKERLQTKIMPFYIINSSPNCAQNSHYLTNIPHFKDCYQNYNNNKKRRRRKRK